MNKRRAISQGGRQHQRLLRKLTPSKFAHQKYLCQVAEFTDQCSSLFLDLEEAHEYVPISELNVIRSELFGREYLVAYVDSDWLGSLAPYCDAVATPELNMGRFLSPPMVLAPETKSRSKGVIFRSTLEHEFVHVNQAILGRFPELNGIKNRPFQCFLEHVQAEYEANFLQLFRWPKLYSKAKAQGLSLEEWCVLRGYTQALEKVVAAVLDGKLSKIQVERLLKECQKKLPSGLQQLGLDRKTASEFANRLPPYLAQAVTMFANGGPAGSTQGREGILALTAWISLNLPLSKTTGSLGMTENSGD